MKKRKHFRNLNFAFIMLAALGITSCSGVKDIINGNLGGLPGDTIHAPSSVNDVIALLTNLNDSSSEEEVIAARNAYEALNSTEKEFVPDFLVKNLIAQENRIASAKKVAAVIALIESLTENSTLSEVEEARTAYESLTDEEKVSVTNYDKLDRIEVYLVLKTKALEFEAKVEVLTSESTAKQIFDILREYNALDEEVKSLVSSETVSKLNALYEAKREVIDLALKVSEGIDTLNNLSTKTEILDVRAEYDALTSEAKEIVGNESLAKLEAQEQKLVNMETAAGVITSKVNSLTEDSLSDLKVLTSLSETKEAINEINSLLSEFSSTYGELNLEQSVTCLDRITELNEYLNTFVTYGANATDGFSIQGCDGEAFSYPINIRKENDSSYGEIFACELNEGNHHLEIRLANDLVVNDFSNVDYYFFYFYNPTQNSFPLSFSTQSNWAGKLFEKVINPGWNKIEIASGLSSRIRFLCSTLSTTTRLESVDGTWKMTKAYGSCGVADAYTVTKPVSEGIKALTDESSETEVKSLREAYEALTIDQKAFIDNLDILEAQELRIKLSKALERASAIINRIDDLPDTIESTDEGILLALSQMGDLRDVVNEYIEDFGLDLTKEYISNYEKYEEIAGLTNGYDLVYGNGATDGFSGDGCDRGANYSYPINTRKEFDDTYGSVFACELFEGGNGWLEMRILNDPLLNNFDEYQSYYMYFYNPTNATFTLNFSAGSNWGGKVFDTSIAPGWNKIEIDSSKSMALRFLCTTQGGTNLKDTAGTWKLSGIVGVKKGN